jgi:hypothetical protein
MPQISDKAERNDSSERGKPKTNEPVFVTRLGDSFEQTFQHEVLQNRLRRHMILQSQILYPRLELHGFAHSNTSMYCLTIF